MRAVLRVDPPLLRDVFEHALREAGIDVVGSPPDSLALLLAIKERRAEVVILTALRIPTTPRGRQASAATC